MFSLVSQKIWKIRYSIATLLLISTTTLHAQYLRTSYFMEGEPIRLNINPALTPYRSYFTVPLLYDGINMSSNVFGTQYFSDFIGNGKSSNYFMSSNFIDKLQNRNYLSMNLDLNLLNFGKKMDNAFCNFNMTLRTSVDVRYPKELFHFMRDMHSGRGIDWSNMQYDISGDDGTLTSYLETGIGYSRTFISRLTIGLKAKFLLGIANLHTNMDKMKIDFNLQNVDENVDWSNLSQDEIDKIRGHVNLNMHATIDGYCKSISIAKDAITNEVDEYEYNNFEFSGKGVAFDLGLNLKLNEQMSVSAAITDFGAIKWKSDACIKTEATASVNYNCPDDTDALVALLGSGEAYNSEAFDCLTMYESDEQHTSKRIWLNSNIVAGFEYKPIEKISLGVLSSSHLARKSSTEITLSSVFSPVKKINLALSYSLLQSRARTFGLAVGLGNILFVGTDYMWLKNNSKTANIVFGLSIPLGRMPQEEE